MDILSCPVINIGGRLYCKYPIEGSNQFDNFESLSEDRGQQYSSYEDEEDCVDDGVTESRNGFEARVTLPCALFGFIIGAQGSTRKRIESDTQTRLLFPPRGQEGDIVITGKARKNVASAKNRIELLAAEKRWKLKPTHFVSIPLNHEEIKSALTDFKAAVLDISSHNITISEELFQGCDKFHLTIGTLVLLNDAEIQSARDIFQKCMTSDVIRTLCESRIKVMIEGIEYMNDDPTAVDVLYAKVNTIDNSLQVLVDTVANTFQDTEFMQRQYDGVKLHATVMNTLFRSKLPESNTYKYSNAKRINFDAKEILDNFSTFAFGEFNLNEIHLSERFTTGSNGYYKAVHVCKI